MIGYRPATVGCLPFLYNQTEPGEVSVHKESLHIGRNWSKHSAETPCLYVPVEDWWNEEAVENYESDDVDKIGGFEK